MAPSIDWPTGRITVQQSDTSLLTLLSGTLYEFDTEAFRAALKDAEDSLEGMLWLDTHTRNPAVVISGVTYVPADNLINGYTLEFLPDAQWSVIMDGSTNNNFADIAAGVLIQNQVQVIPQNSAGNTLSVTTQNVLDPADQTRLREMHEVYGLDSAKPVTHQKDPAKILWNGQEITLTEQPNGDVIATRTP